MKKDGSFQIFYKDGTAFLTVFPREEGGRPVYYEEIQGKLKLLEIPPVRKQTVFEILDEAAGEPRPLTAWPDGEKRGPVIRVTVGEGGLEADISAEPEKTGGEPLSLELLEKALEKEGIVYGIQKDSLRALISRGLFGVPVPAARGEAAVNRQPARVEYLFSTVRGKPFLEKEYQRIDLRELNFIQNCRAGDLLARLLEPVPPKNGRDIYGREIPADLSGEPPLFQAGEGAELSADGKAITARVDGNVKLENARVVVEPVITVADVDYSNGNMDYNGALDIQGRIADGFSVTAKGDIQIGKSVSRVRIESGGDMLLKAGISGNDEGELICRGDLYARYIENARVICRGNLFVEEAIMHSRVRVEKDIILTGKRAEIFGGRLVAGGTIRCKKLGSLNEPQTELYLGVALEDFSRLEELETLLQEENRLLDEVDTKLRQLRHGAAKEEPGPLLDKLALAIRQMEEQAGELNSGISEKLRELHERRRELKIRETSRMEAEQRVFGQVTVHFGPLLWHSPQGGTYRTALEVRQGKIVEKGQ